MIKSIVVPLIAFLYVQVLSAQSSSYVNGYQSGYKYGYCYDDKLNCMAPIAPLTPIPELDEDSNSFKDGYIRGFIDGQKIKSRKSTDINSSQNLPANYGEYIQPIDISMVNYVLSTKQKNANRKRNYEYQKAVSKAISSNVELYNIIMDFLVSHEGLFYWVEKYQKDFQNFFDPSKIINPYPQQMSINEAEKLITELQKNYDTMMDNLETISNFTSDFWKHPNEVIKGYHNVTSIMDFEYDKVKGGYVQVKAEVSKEMGDAYLTFSQNKIIFKRLDSTKPLQNAFRYDKLEDGYYKFFDGYGQQIWITKDNVFLDYYHKLDSNGVYTKKTSYLVMGGFNFLK